MNRKVVENRMAKPRSKRIKSQNRAYASPYSDSVRADLTKKEDLCIGVMNLISLEEHLSFTAMKTGKREYLHMMDAIRKMRIKYLQELVTNREGELWCISKHLLAATMRLMETATKYIGKDDEKARGFAKSAFDTYSLFWLLQNMGDDNAARGLGKKARLEKKNK